MKKKTVSIQTFSRFDNQKMARKHEKRCYELFPYAGLWLISCNTIQSLLIFDLNIEYGESTEANDTI